MTEVVVCPNGTKRSMESYASPEFGEAEPSVGLELGQEPKVGLVKQATFAVSAITPLVRRHREISALEFDAGKRLPASRRALKRFLGL
jgi:hypothetical protein